MRNHLPALVVLLALMSCKSPAGLFIKKTAHDQYGDRISQAGLTQTALGNGWFTSADKAVVQPMAIQLPYKENGYFAAEQASAAGFRFQALRGEQLTIELSQIPVNNFQLFADLFMTIEGKPKHLQSVDSVNNQIRYTVKENSTFILRIQPELLKSGSYMVIIKTGPSLGFPAPSTGNKNRVISYWGAGRDNGTRNHEGVDIGGSRGTPLLAVGNGQVSSVTDNNLGGKVVFIRSEEGNENWYYAHLDSQLVSAGQRVRAGDTIGLMGNTGNARTTAPHLHFGIYTKKGAVDPFPYINPERKEPKLVTAPTVMLGKKMRLKGKPPLYLAPDLKEPQPGDENLPVLITAATQHFYKAILPGGETRFVAAANVEPLEQRIKQLTLTKDRVLTNVPMPDSPVIRNLAAGAVVDLLGLYGDYQYVKAQTQYGWISQ